MNLKSFSYLKALMSFGAIEEHSGMTFRSQISLLFLLVAFCFQGTAQVLITRYPLDGTLGDVSTEGRNASSEVSNFSTEAGRQFWFTPGLITAPVWQPGTNSFSVSLWFRFQSVTTFTRVVTGAGTFWRCPLISSEAGGFAHGYRIWLSSVDGVNATISMHVRGSYDAANDPLILNVPASGSVWHHVVLVVDRSFNRMRAYLDGSLVEDIPAGPQDVRPIDFFLGGYGDWVGASQLDDVRIYRGPLSAQQIGRLASNEEPGPGPDGSQIAVTGSTSGPGQIRFYPERSNYASNEVVYAEAIPSRLGVFNRWVEPASNNRQISQSVTSPLHFRAEFQAKPFEQQLTNSVMNGIWNRRVDLPNGFTDLAYNDYLGRVVAVGRSGRIYWSDDAGVTWTAGVSGTTAHLKTVRPIAFDVSDGTGTIQHFLAAGDSATLLRSPDGKTWFQVPMPNLGGEGIVRLPAEDRNSPCLGILASGRLMVSGTPGVSGVRGLEWHTRLYSNHPGGAVANLIPGSGYPYVAVGDAFYAIQEIDTWSTIVPLPKFASSINVNDATKALGKIVAVDGAGKVFLHDTTVAPENASAWTVVQTQGTTPLFSVSRLGTGEGLMAGFGSAAGVAGFSTDGTNWLTRRIGSATVTRMTLVNSNIIVATGDGIWVNTAGATLQVGSTNLSVLEDGALEVALSIDRPAYLTPADLGSLLWTVESSNPDLIGPEDVRISTNSVGLTLRLVPKPNRSGEAVLRISAPESDLGRPIRVVVTPVVDPLAIGIVSNVQTRRGNSIAMPPFRITDVEESNPLISLVLTAGSGRIELAESARSRLQATNVVVESGQRLDLIGNLTTLNEVFASSAPLLFAPEAGYIGQTAIGLSVRVVDRVTGAVGREGTNQVQVSILGTDFDAWAAELLAAAPETTRTNTLAAELAESADADRDNQENHLEMAFGSNPFDAQSRGEVTHGLVLSNGLYHFQLSYPRAVPAGQFVPAPALSTNLKEWSPAWHNLMVISNHMVSATVERVWVQEMVGSASPERYGRVIAARNVNLAIANLVEGQVLLWTGPDTALPIAISLDTAGSPVRLLRLRQGTNVVATANPPDLSVAFRSASPGTYQLSVEVELASGEIISSSPLSVTFASPFQPEWLTRIDGFGAASDPGREIFPRKITRDSNGNVFAAVRVSSRKIRLRDFELASPVPVGGDALLLAKFNPQGLPLWATWFSGAGDPLGLKTLADGRLVLLSGFSSPATVGTVQTGDLKQQLSFSSTSGPTNGRAFLATFSANGIPQVLRYLPDPMWSLATAGTDRIAVASWFSQTALSIGMETGPLWVAEYDPQLNLRWTREIPKGRGGNASMWNVFTDSLEFGSDGGLLWGGHFVGSLEVGQRLQAAQDRPNAAVIRLSAQGGFQWVQPAISSVLDPGIASGIHQLVPTADGGLVALASAGSGGMSGDLVVARFDVSGVRQWERVIPKRVNALEFFHAFGDPLGGVLMAHGQPDINFLDSRLEANSYLTRLDTNGVTLLRNVPVGIQASVRAAALSGNSLVLGGRVPQKVEWNGLIHTNANATEWQVDGYLASVRVPYLGENVPLIPFTGDLGAVLSAEPQQEYASGELIVTNLTGPREVRLTHTFPPGAAPRLRINGTDLLGDRLDVTNGMTVQIVGTSGTAEGDSRHAYLSLAGFETRWSIHRPPAPDRLPAPFVFETVREVVTNAWLTSTNVVISDLEVPVQATNTAGILVVNGVEVGFGPVTVTNGTILAVRLQAPVRYVPSASTRVTVGEYSTDFVLELKAPAIEVPAPSFDVAASVSTVEGALQVSQPISFYGTNGTWLRATPAMSVYLNGSVVGTNVQLTRGDLIRFRANAPQLNGILDLPYTIGDLASSWRISTTPAPEARPAPAGPVSGYIDGSPSVTPGGAALYSIPIFAPPGTAGLDPELALAYSSQGSFGAVGVGWSLQGISVITRVAQTMAQDGRRGGINLDPNDRFALNGERLMLATGTVEGADGADYRTEKDSFQRVRVVGRQGNGPLSFQVKTKSGLTLDFGATADSRLLANRNGSVAPTNAVLSWALSRITDTAGNYLTFTYLNDALNGEVNLSRVDYTGNPNAGLLPFASLRCEYETNTVSVLTYLSPDRVQVPNPDVRYVAGSRMQGTKRLKRIAAYIGEQIVRRYDLGYEFRGLLGRPHLTSVTETGRDGVSHPPTTFAYEGQNAEAGNASGGGYEHPLLTFGNRQSLVFNQGISEAKYWFVDPNLSSLNMGRIRMGDFNADGRADMYFLRGAEECGGDEGQADRIFFSQDYSSPTQVYPAVEDAVRHGISSIICGSAFGAIDLARYQVGDFNGDGFADLYEINRRVSPARKVEGLTHLNIPPDPTRTEQRRWHEAPGVEAFVGDDEEALADLSRFRFMDFDGDGRTDIYRFVSRDNVVADNLHLARGGNNGAPFRWETYKAIRHQIPGLSAGSGQNYSDQVTLASARFHFADFNGDGRTDILQIKGRGTNRADVVLHLFPNSLPNVDRDVAFVELPNRFAGLNLDLRVRQDFEKALIDLSRVKPGDFNGDGLTDLYIVHEPGPGVQTDAILFSRGDGSFFKANGLQTAVSDSSDDRTKVDLARIKMADFNGDGKTDIFRMRGDDTMGDVSTMDVIHLSNGDGTFQGPYKALNYAVNSDDEKALSDVSRVQFADINGDGRADVLAMRDEPGDGFSVNPRLQLVAHPELLTTVITGHGGITKFAYKPLSALRDTVSPATRPYPFVPFRAGLYVVSEMQQSNGLAPDSGEPTLNTSHFDYFGGVLDVSGRGFLGFEEVRQRDLARGSETVTKYVVNDGIKAGMPLSSKLFVTNRAVSPVKRQLVSSTDFTPVAKRTSTNSWLTYQEQQIATEYDFDTGAALKTTKTFLYYNNETDIRRGNLTSTTQIISRGDSSGADEFRETSEHRYADDESRWFLGRLDRSTVTKRVFLGDGRMLETTRVSAFRYDPTTGFRTEETIEPDRDELYWRKAYQFNVFGGIEISTQTAGLVNSGPPRQLLTYYESTGRFITNTVNARGHTEDATFDPGLGVKLTQTGPNGLTTRWEFDGFGRATSERRADGTTSRTYYRRVLAGNGPPSAVYFVESHPDGGGIQRTYFDLLGREVRRESQGFDGRWILTDSVYNSRGQKIRESRPYFLGESPQWNRFLFDDAGRLALMEEPGNRLHTTEYSLTNGLPKVTTVNPLGQRNSRVTDIRGQLVESTDNLGQSVLYAYDAYGNLLRTQHGTTTLVVTELEYDVRGRKVAMRDPSLGRLAYRYNGFGELIYQRDNTGYETVLDYDTLGRMTYRRDPDGEFRWFFDTSEFGKGLIARVEGPGGYRERHFFDALARPCAVVKDLPDGSGKTLELGLGTSYDPFSRPDRITYPSGFTLRHLYNEFGFLSQVRSPSQGDHRYWAAIEYNAHGQILREELGNSVVRRQSYDADTQFLTNILSTLAVEGSPRIQELTYAWNVVGNLLQRGDRMLAANEVFAYDGLNRLVSANVGSTTVSLTFDDLGNIRSKSDVGTYAYDRARPMAVAAITGGPRSNEYAYDNNGNRVASRNETVRYNHRAQPMELKSLRNGSVSTFRYDPAGDRYAQTTTRTNGETRTRLYLGGLYELEAIFGDSPVIKETHYVRAGGQLVALHHRTNGDAGTNQCVLTDHLGSIERLTDDWGGVSELYSYDAWGRRRDHASWQPVAGLAGRSTPRGFTGHEHLDEFEIVHMNARLYDPITGRFCSADSQVQGGLTGDELNRYTYGMNRPLCGVDPDGHFFFLPVIIAAVTAFTTDFIVTLGTGGSFGDALVSGLKSASISAGITLATMGVGIAFDAIASKIGSLAISTGQKGALLAANRLGRAAAHGAVSAIDAKLQGESGASGFATAATASIAAGAMHHAGAGKVSQLLVASAVGAGIGKATGSSFLSGAATAVNVYAHNDALQSANPTQVFKISIEKMGHFQRNVSALASILRAARYVARSLDSMEIDIKLSRNGGYRVSAVGVANDMASGKVIWTDYFYRGNWGGARRAAGQFFEYGNYRGEIDGNVDWIDETDSLARDHDLGTISTSELKDIYRNRLSNPLFSGDSLDARLQQAAFIFGPSHD